MGLGRGRAACALAVVAAAGAIAAASAQAATTTDTRHAAIADLADQPRNPDGTFSAADIAVVTADYSPSGSLRLLMTFYGPVPSSSPYTASWVVSAGTCQNAVDPGARVVVTAPVGDPGVATAAVSGYLAPITSKSTLVDNRRMLSVGIRDPTLVGRDFRCVQAATASAGPGGTAVVADAVPRFSFGGFPAITGPPAPRVPRCSDGVDNDRDGTIDAQDLGCNSPRDNSENLTRVPTLTTAKARSLTRAALVKRYGRAFTRGAGYHRDCRRKTRLAVTCRVAWRTRTARYRGTVSVASAQLGEKVYPLTKVAVHKRGRR
jgi:hypothetical protein